VFPISIVSGQISLWRGSHLGYEQWLVNFRALVVGTRSRPYSNSPATL